MSSSTDLPTLTKYELLAKIGQGGTGTVYKARPRGGGGLVAVKIIPEPLDGDRVALKRLEQEFLTVSRLGHPGIVRGLDFGQEGSSHYLVMELLDGITLGERIELHGALAESVAVGVITDVALALQAAHQQGLVHRDVKPTNVMLTREGQVKLTDFGIVKELATGPALTKPTDLLGTPHFMAPELFEGAQYASVRSDIYSLAATLHMAVTGRVPFPGKSWLTILTRKLSQPLPLVRQQVPGLSQPIERAIIYGLHPDPEHRPGSCLEFLDILESSSSVLTSGPGIEVPAAGPPPTPSERRCQPRRRARGTARYRPSARPYDPFGKAILVDASVSGVQLLVPAPFTVGEGIEVELLRPLGGSALVREAEVRWAATPHSRHYRLGCSWRQPLTYADLLAFA